MRGLIINNYSLKWRQIVVVSILNRNLKKKLKKYLSTDAHYPSMGLFMGSVLLSVDIPQIVEN